MDIKEFYLSRKKMYDRLDDIAIESPICKNIIDLLKTLKTVGLNLDEVHKVQKVCFESILELKNCEDNFKLTLGIVVSDVCRVEIQKICLERILHFENNVDSAIH